MNATTIDWDALIREDPLMLLGDPAAGVIFTAYGAHWQAHDAAGGGAEASAILETKPSAGDGEATPSAAAGS